MGRNMGIPISIDNLINRRIVESSRVEFNADWNPEPVLHTICAFANDIDNMGGGYIVLGVEEKNGQPVIPIKGNRVRKNRRYNERPPKQVSFHRTFI